MLQLIIRFQMCLIVVIQEMKLKHTREIEKLSDQLVQMEAQRKELKAEIDVLTNRIEQLEANEMDNK